MTSKKKKEKKQKTLVKGNIDDAYLCVCMCVLFYQYIQTGFW